MTAPSLPTPSNPGALNWALILGLGVIWGAAFLSVRISLEGFAPWSVAAYRAVLAAGVLWVFALVLGQPLRTVSKAKGWPAVIAIGAGAIALPFALLSWGQQFIASAFAGVAIGAVPLFVLPLVALFSPEEGIGPRRIGGLVLGFLGIALLMGPEALRPTGASLELWGRAACLGAASCYAVGSVLTRRAPAMPPVAFAAATMIVAAVVLLPIALWQDGLAKAWPLRPSLALLYAALLPTALAAVIRIRVITTAGSMFMSLTSYMVPVWSVIFGIIVLSEDLPANLYAALALILAGIGLAQSRSIAAAWAAKKKG